MEASVRSGTVDGYLIQRYSGFCSRAGKAHHLLAKQAIGTKPFWDTVVILIAQYQNVGVVVLRNLRQAVQSLFCALRDTINHVNLLQKERRGYRQIHL